jgi:hypothetical protein
LQLCSLLQEQQALLNGLLQLLPDELQALAVTAATPPTAAALRALLQDGLVVVLLAWFVRQLLQRQRHQAAAPSSGETAVGIAQGRQQLLLRIHQSCHSAMAMQQSKWQETVQAQTHLPASEGSCKTVQSTDQQQLQLLSQVVRQLKQTTAAAMTAAPAASRGVHAEQQQLQGRCA